MVVLGNETDKEYTLTSDLSLGDKIRWTLSILPAPLPTITTKERLALVCDGEKALSVTVKYSHTNNKTTVNALINGQNSGSEEITNLPSSLILELMVVSGEVSSERQFNLSVDGQVVIGGLQQEATDGNGLVVVNTLPYYLFLSLSFLLVKVTISLSGAWNWMEYCLPVWRSRHCTN